jgi:hypothetical protein
MPLVGLQYVRLRAEVGLIFIAPPRDPAAVPKADHVFGWLPALNAASDTAGEHTSSAWGAVTTLPLGNTEQVLRGMAAGEIGEGIVQRALRQVCRDRQPRRGKGRAAALTADDVKAQRLGVESVGLGKSADVGVQGLPGERLDSLGERLEGR